MDNIDAESTKETKKKGVAGKGKKQWIRGSPRSGSVYITVNTDPDPDPAALKLITI